MVITSASNAIPCVFFVHLQLDRFLLFARFFAESMEFITVLGSHLWSCERLALMWRLGHSGALFPAVLIHPDHLSERQAEKLVQEPVSPLEFDPSP